MDVDLLCIVGRSFGHFEIEEQVLFECFVQFELLFDRL